MTSVTYEEDMKYEKWLLEIVAKYYESSIGEAHDYLEIYYSSEQGKADLKPEKPQKLRH